MPRSVLSELFGYDDFRPGQSEAVASLIEDRDVVVVLPTGAGKSVCYQVPAIVKSRAGLGTTIVISPLIALMHDQVSALTGRGIRAKAINSHQDDADRKDVVAEFLRGELELLYVSPERAALDSFRRMLKRVPVAMLAIDEAHCISQWGHDFRPEYLRLGELTQILEVPTIALTATATPKVVDEIAKRLGLRAPTIIKGDFCRPNLSFAVRHARTDASRIEALVRALEVAGLRGRRGQDRAIVYCSTRKKTETVSKALKSAGFAAGHYHAGRTKLARERAQRSFDLEKTRVLVATNAFGMGIDIPNIRLIVHFQAPGSLEAYYQEAGRAGRDGRPARCELFFGPGDLMTQRRLQANAAHEEKREDALLAVDRYANADRCRQQILANHFTETDDAPACGLCDVCTDVVEHAAPAAPKAEVEALPAEAKAIIVEAAGNLRCPVGKTSLARALRGSRAKALKRMGLLTLPEHGKLKAHAEASIVRAIEMLLEEGILERRGQKFPTVWLAGRAVRPRAVVGAPKVRASRPGFGPVARELENYRKRVARSLRWKPYMVFHRRVIMAIDRERPESHEALARIPGLGVVKIQRFGDDILELVRRHASS